MKKQFKYFISFTVTNMHGHTIHCNTTVKTTARICTLARVAKLHDFLRRRMAAKGFINPIVGNFKLLQVITLPVSLHPGGFLPRRQV
jgi:hypothetical protein